MRRGCRRRSSNEEEHETTRGMRQPGRGADDEGLDPEVVAQLFTLLVDYFTHREQRVVDARTTDEEGGDG
jgi:hypothetical protein